MRRLIIPIAAAVLVAVFCAGIWLGGHPYLLPNRVQDLFVDEDVSLQAEAAKLIEDRYYRAVNPEQLSNASIKGMVRSLRDRFSFYLTPRQNRLYKQSLHGRFSGVGMTVVEARRGLRVVGLFPRSPARRAGIEPGDLVVAVDGTSIAGEPSNVSAGRIKGPAGTLVTLTVVHDGKRRIQKIKRETIEVPQVLGRIRTVRGERLGFLVLASFADNVSSDLRHQIERLQGRGARGFVLDLRGNGGGLVTEAVAVASVFIPDGKIVTLRGRKTPTKVYTALGDELTDKPAVVLVDRHTASASEIVTAALQERYGATVVGRRTLGKGVFGQVFELGNGGALDLVEGRYYTPDGSSLAGKGVRPNVVLSPRVSRDPHEALRRALEVLAAKVRRDLAGAR
jgi:carboxyl-terminal processing protease